MKLTLMPQIFFKMNDRSPGKQPARFDTEQAQRLSDIGEQLRQARIHHSLSLDMVAAYTRIRSHLLQALEDGQMDRLPEPVYTQGLIRQYADALGLDGEELANFFLPEPTARSLQTSLGMLSIPPLRPSHLYLTYTLLVICAVNGLSYLIRTSPESPAADIEPDSRPVELAQNPASAPTSSPPVPQSRLVAQSSTVKVETASPSPGATPSSKLASQDVEVGITVKDESWVLIEVDGKTEFQGILPGGTEKSWKAKDQVVVVAGNAGGVLVTVNNGEAKRLGEPGMVEEAVFKVGNTRETDEMPSS